MSPLVIISLILSTYPLYEPYKFEPPQRVGFFGLFNLKTGAHFANFGLESVIVFGGTMGSV